MKFSKIKVKIIQYYINLQQPQLIGDSVIEDQNFQTEVDDEIRYSENVWKI